MSIIKAKEKSNKIHENIIGKIIYGFLLFAPLLMILTTSCYAIFNKNAHESYYGETINNQQKYYYETNNQLIENPDNLYMENNYFVGTTLSGTLNYTSVKYITGSFANNTAENIAFINASNRCYIYRGTSITFYNDTENTTFVMSSISGLELMFKNITSTPQTNVLAPAFYKWIYNKYSYLDNNFDYGIYKTEQSQYFNWSKSTALYTGLRATCQSLGIENTFTPMLMAYWLLISIIYFIFDIGLIMVHIVHRKIHEFTESV